MAEPFPRNLFSQPSLDPRLGWHCEPTHWSLDPERGSLRIQPDAATDFWQRTHYGFRVDNGHFLSTALDGDFVLTTRVRFQPVHQYDQAGLMVRLTEDFWIKTSVEYESDGLSRLGVVVTNHGFSDWSTQDVSSELRDVALRIRRDGSDYTVEYSAGAIGWSQLRLAHLHEDHPPMRVQAGVYACCPKDAGYWAEFDALHIEIHPQG